MPRTPSRTLCAAPLLPSSGAPPGRHCAEHRVQERHKSTFPGVRTPGREKYDAAEETSVGGEVGRVAHDAVRTGGDELVVRLDRDLEAEVAP